MPMQNQNLKNALDARGNGIAAYDIVKILRVDQTFKDVKDPRESKIYSLIEGGFGFIRYQDFDDIENAKWFDGINVNVDSIYINNDEIWRFEFPISSKDIIVIPFNAELYSIFQSFTCPLKRKKSNKPGKFNYYYVKNIIDRFSLFYKDLN
jgi:hypothetical protein